ncbi:hypothetical protein CJF30_00001819 [Rutstroemia sp. NJR-2017a BBW]|nr:hypothetical protein CJF30_00001819 [Rutstroemia sp. NJR-2017a BBW]
MNFSTDPSDFKFTNCVYDFLNGTSVYYNYSSSSIPTCLCVAKFQADPDIGGPGVFLAFVLTAWITCFVSLFAWYCLISNKFNDYLSTTRDGNFKENLQYIASSMIPFGPNSCDGIKNHSIRRLAQSIRRGAHVGVVGFLHIFSDGRPRATEFSLPVLDVLCDVQVFTGISIMIAAFARMNTMAFYHQYLILNYYCLTLNSFMLGRSGKLSQSHQNGNNDSMDTWHYWTRLFLNSVASVLYLIFELLIMNRQAMTWSPVESGRCFVSNDNTSSLLSFMWLFGIGLYTAYDLLALVARLTSRGSLTWMDRFANFTNRQEKNYRKKYKNWVGSLIQRIKRPNTNSINTTRRSYGCMSFDTGHSRFRDVCLKFALKLIILYCPLFVWWCFFQVFALWASGDSESIIQIAMLFGFCTWNTYDLVDMKLSNTSLVPDETAWGFGQVLPLALLGLILLNILDSAQGMEFSDSMQHVFVY